MPLLQAQLGGGVFAEEGVIADVAAHGGKGFMAGLAHDVELGCVIQIRLGHEAGAQTVAGKQGLIEAGALDGAFQNARHRRRMQPLVLQPSETVDPPEDRPRPDSALFEPALIRAHGTSRRRRAIRNADGSPGAFLVGLRAIECEHQAVGALRHVFDIERAEFGAAQAAGEADEQQGLVAPAGQIVGQLRQHFFEIAREHRFFLRLGDAGGALDAFECFAHNRLPHAGWRGKPLRLVRPAESRQFPSKCCGLASLPRQIRQIESDGFGCGRQGWHFPRTTPSRKMLPVGAIGAQSVGGLGRLNQGGDAGGQLVPGGDGGWVFCGF